MLYAQQLQLLYHFLFNDLLFCDDSLERVPAVAVEGATQKKYERKKISVLPSPRPHCPNYYWYYKKDEKKKERQNQKTKKLPVHISMSQTVPKKIYKKQSLLDLDIRPEVKKRKTFKKRCIIKATKFEIKTNTNDVTKQSPVRIPCFLKKKTAKVPIL